MRIYLLALTIVMIALCVFVALLAWHNLDSLPLKIVTTVVMGTSVSALVIAITETLRHWD